MKNYKFKLSDAYCLYNGIAVKEQNGSAISFYIQNIEDEILKEKIRTAFNKYILFVKNQEDYPDSFCFEPEIKFIHENIKHIRECLADFKSVEMLGYSKMQCNKLKEFCLKQSGLLFICGNSHSGKTRTSLSLYSEIQKLGRNGIYIQKKDIEKIDLIKNNKCDVLIFDEIKSKKTVDCIINCVLTGKLVIANVQCKNISELFSLMKNFGYPKKFLLELIDGIIVQNWNIVQKNTNLLVDLALIKDVPKKELFSLNIENCFYHYTNYLEVTVQGINQLYNSFKKKKKNKKVI